MPVTEEQLAAAAAWLQAHAQVSEQVKQVMEQTAGAAWSGFEAWYEAAAVTAIATRMANASLFGQQSVSGAARAYAAQMAAIVQGGPATVPSLGEADLIRNGAPLSLVHSRPAETYRKAVAVGKSEQEAERLAVQRAQGIIVADVSLVDRDTQVRTLRALRLDRYRRVIRPELSRTGTCGLCVAASDRIYYVKELMPIHPPSCKCITMPIGADVDPGQSLNEVDLGQLYTDAGSTGAADLRRTRYKVAEHGEYGPVLVRAEDEFRARSKVALEDDPERAGRLLDKATPVLRRMEDGDATSDAQLDYQRDLVERLASIVGAAA